MNGRIVSINVAQASPLAVDGRHIMSAIGKRPHDGPVAVHALGLDGDQQADPAVHGGLAKAVYAAASEHYPVWRTLRSQAGAAAWDAELPWGAFGENLTLAGLTEAAAHIGDRLCFDGGVILVVSEPRWPCFKFDAAMGFRLASKMMVESGHCGYYLRVAKPGRLAPGARFELQPGPREVGIAELFRARRPRYRGATGG